MQEMNRLIQCHDEKECFFLLNLSTCLKDIPYPKIYEKIANLKNHEMIPYCATNFSILIGEVIRTFMLVLDQFVEEDLFGKEFGQLFLKAINEMAENKIEGVVSVNSSIGLFSSFSMIYAFRRQKDFPTTTKDLHILYAEGYNFPQNHRRP